MSRGRDRKLLAFCLALQAGVFATVALAARSGCAPSTVAIGLGIGFAPYAGVLRLSTSLGGKRELDRLALVAALGFGGALVLAPPMLSDDVYRYLWEGRLWLEGLNPYRLAPDDPTLGYLRDADWALINNRPIASIYPPLSQALFAVAAWFGGSVASVKLLALFAHVLCVAGVARMSSRPEASLALAVNPLVLGEGPLNGHFDVLTGLALLVAAWALARSRFGEAGLAVVSAVGLKVVGLLALPLLLRRPRVLLGTALASALLLLPLVASRAPTDPGSGAGQFATRWRGNESLFALVDWASHQALPESIAGLAARIAVVLLVVALATLLVHRRTPPFTASRMLLWAVLLLSPQVHPWYLCWLLPLEVAVGARAGLLWSATVLCAYAPLDRWIAEGVWEMPLGFQILEYGLVLLALWIDPKRPSLGGAREERGFLHNSRYLA